MGFVEAGRQIIIVQGKDGKEYKLAVLEMQQIIELAAYWNNKRKAEFVELLKQFGLSYGQQLVALRDFARDTSSFSDTRLYGLTPEGIDRTLMLAMKVHQPDFQEGDLPVLGLPKEREELAMQVLDFISINPKKVESLPDPLVVTPTTAAEK